MSVSYYIKNVETDYYIGLGKLIPNGYDIKLSKSIVGDDANFIWQITPNAGSNQYTVTNSFRNAILSSLDNIVVIDGNYYYDLCALLHPSFLTTKLYTFTKNDNGTYIAFDPYGNQPVIYSEIGDADSIALYSTKVWNTKANNNWYLIEV